MPAGNCFPHVISIERKTTTVDSAGGQSVTYAPLYSHFAALVSPASSSVIELYMRRSLIITHKVYTAKQIAIQVGDIVVFGDRAFYIESFRNIMEANLLFEMACREATTTEDIIQGRRR